jgi:hypothetical protein
MQLLLAKEANVPLETTLGKRTVTRTYMEPSGFWARTRRWLSKRLWWVYPPLYRREVSVEETPGLSEHSVWRYLVLHQEHEQAKSDRAEAEGDRARRQAGLSNVGDGQQRSEQ